MGVNYQDEKKIQFFSLFFAKTQEYVDNFLLFFWVVFFGPNNHTQSNDVFKKNFSKMFFGRWIIHISSLKLIVIVVPVISRWGTLPSPRTKQSSEIPCQLGIKQ